MHAASPKNFLVEAASIACVSRTAFPRLPLSTVGKRRTAFLSRSIFAPRICRNRIVRDREAHGTKTVPWLPAGITQMHGIYA